MMRGKIHTLIFDLGGVLVDWNPEYLFRKIIPDEAERNYFLSEICSPDWNAKQDAGRPLAEATSELVLQYPHYARQIASYYGRWTEMVGGPIQGTVEILENLAQKNSFRLLALTNWSQETFPYALENFDFLKHFEGILVSGHEKLIKPDPRIFELCIQRYSIENTAGVLFIDDNIANVEAAKRIGMQAVQFTSPEHLRKYLSLLT
jgi:2-haloacid dehalogenase